MIAAARTARAAGIHGRIFSKQPRLRPHDVYAATTWPPTTTSP